MDGSPQDAGNTTGSAVEGAVATPARILVAYATRHGSTAEIAEWITRELRDTGAQVDLVGVDSAPPLDGYDAVFIGGPMIMGWHRGARRFLRTHRDALATVPTALFVVAASLTETGEDAVDGVPITKDPRLAREPRTPGKLRRRERYATPAHYLEAPFKAAPGFRPAAVAFFGGSLDLTRMSFLEKLFVMAAIGVAPGDARNPTAVRDWARDVAPRLLAGRP